MVKFREFITSSGLVVFAGRDADNNDLLVKQAKRNDTLLHTQSPGSPFCNVGEGPSKKDVSEAAVFCAKYSQDWRDRKGDVIVNNFLRSDMKKSFFMKSGTWAVKKQEKIKVKKEDILKLEKKLNLLEKVGQNKNAKKVNKNDKSKV